MNMLNTTSTKHTHPPSSETTLRKNDPSMVRNLTRVRGVIQSPSSGPAASRFLAKPGCVDLRKKLHKANHTAWCLCGSLAQRVVHMPHQDMDVADIGTCAPTMLLHATTRGSDPVTHSHPFMMQSPHLESFAICDVGVLHADSAAPESVVIFISNVVDCVSH